MALPSILDMEDVVQAKEPQTFQPRETGIRSILDMEDVTTPSTTVSQTMKPEPTTWDQLKERAKVIIQYSQPEEVQKDPIRAAIQVGGESIGAFFDVAGALLGGAMKLVTSKEDREIASNAMQQFYSWQNKVDPTWKYRGSVEGIMESFGKFEERNPVAGETIRNLANIALAAPLPEFKAMAESKFVKPKSFIEAEVITQTEKAMDAAIAKGIKPSMKPTAQKATQYKERARDAFRVINEYKPTFTDEVGETITRNPVNRAELLDAIGQSKKQIFAEYDDLAKRAGESGVQFNPTSIDRELARISVDKKFNPQVRSYAETLRFEMRELAGESPVVIQERIKDLNQSLGALYEGRVGKAKAQVDLSVAELMRQELDRQINAVTGANYQELKNKYGALSTIERDVARQVAVEARRVDKGLLDFTDVFTSGDLLFGIVSANPGMILKGLGGRAAKEYYKYLNNPNRYIEKVFKLLEKQPVKPKKVDFGGLRPDKLFLPPKGGSRAATGFDISPTPITPKPPTPATTFEPQAAKIGSTPVPKVEQKALPEPTGAMSEGIPLVTPAPTTFEPRATIVGHTDTKVSDPRLKKALDKIEDEIQRRVEEFRKEAGLMASNEGAGVRSRNVTDARGNTEFVTNSFSLNRAKGDMKRRANDLKEEAHSLLYENDPEFRELVDFKDTTIERAIPELKDPLDADEIDRLLGGDIERINNDYPSTEYAKKETSTGDSTKTGTSAKTTKTGSGEKTGTDKALIDEAKKYESAEEFVKAQKKVFRGGEKLDISKIKENGVSTSLSKEVAQIWKGSRIGGMLEEFYISPQAKIFTPDVPTNRAMQFAEKNNFTLTGKVDGFDVVDFSKSGEEELVILNADVLKTKSQLTDIWNQANKNAEK